MEDFTNAILYTGIDVELIIKDKKFSIIATITSSTDAEEVRLGGARIQREVFNFHTADRNVISTYKQKAPININYNNNMYVLFNIRYSQYSGVLSGQLKKTTQN